MKQKRKLISILVFALIFILGCLGSNGGAEPSSAPVLSPEPTFTPKPTFTPEPITFNNICEHRYETVTVQGILHLPDRISCTTGGSPDWCTILFLNPYDDKSMLIGMPLQVGVMDPAHNQMADLPSSYEMSDFRVMTDSGRLVGEGGQVSITGVVTESIETPTELNDAGCSMTEITTIEYLTKIKPIGMDITSAGLSEALEKDWVEVAISGDGLSKIDLDLTPKVDFTLEVSIEEGTIFESSTSGVQNMVVRKGTFVVLEPGIEVSLELEVSCANMELKQPTGDDKFSVGVIQISPDLHKLFLLPEFEFYPVRIQQFAIWTITDNPAPDGYVGLTSTGSGGEPTSEEIQLIREIFTEAGIDISSYRALQ